MQICDQSVSAFTVILFDNLKMILRTTLIVSVLIQIVRAAVNDPVAFTAIKAGRNDAYISFQTLVVNNKVSGYNI